MTHQERLQAILDLLQVNGDAKTLTDSQAILILRKLVKNTVLVEAYNRSRHHPHRLLEELISCP